MFKYIQYEEWQQMLPTIGFAICFTVFVLYVIKTILMKKKDIKHMSNLPLENESIQNEK